LHSFIVVAGGVAKNVSQEIDEKMDNTDKTDKTDDNTIREAVSKAQMIIQSDKI
jgi:hypothetical protein